MYLLASPYLKTVWIKGSSTNHYFLLLMRTEEKKKKTNIFKQFLDFLNSVLILEMHKDENPGIREINLLNKFGFCVVGNIYKRRFSSFLSHKIVHC